MMIPFIVFIVVVGGFFFFVRRSARRYEQRQRQLGRWDEYGPLVETPKPPRPGRGGLFAWRLQNISGWSGLFVRRRDPHQKL